MAQVSGQGQPVGSQVPTPEDKEETAQWEKLKERAPKRPER